MTRTYYDLLGVSPEASAEAVERAYRERLKETHPDVSDAADARDRTRRLIEARDVLTDASESRTGRGRGGRRRRGTAAADREGPGDGSSAGDGRGVGGAGRSQGRRAREHVGTPSWSGHREARAGAARTWNPDSPYAVHRTDDGVHGGRLSPVAPSLALLAAALLAYPVLVAGTLFPGFPLIARVLVGGCALGLVAYLQSVPEVGMAVFGTWFVLGPAALVALGVPLVSAAGAVVAVATSVPLGLSALVRVALR